MSSIHSQLESEFNKLDTNKDGSLSRTEIVQCLKEFGFNSGDAEKAMNYFDENRDGKISKQEFLHGALNKLSHEEVTCASLKKAFSSMDKNGDGTITVQELYEFIDNQTCLIFPKDVEEWIQRHDQNGDKCLNYNEFIDFARQYF